MTRKFSVTAIGVLAIALASPLSAQRPNGAARDTSRAVMPTADSDTETGATRRNFIRQPEWNLGFTSLRLGMGFLWDFASYSQDSASKEQIELEPDNKLRDFRLLARGKFKTARPINWQVGYMFDAANDSWHFRQSGITLGVPEIQGSFFVGRTKEGISANKVMVGYFGWTMERFTFSDAIPILADGVKWQTYLPKHDVYWSVGWFTDVLSKYENFSNSDNTFSVRGVWTPPVGDTANTVLHLGAGVRQAKVNNGVFRLRARPEAFPAPFFVDTDTISASTTIAWGPEIYYRPGSWLFGTEYYFLTVNRVGGKSPMFHGGDVFVSWLPTGEKRPYVPGGAFFGDIRPNRTIFQRGIGAIEPVLRLSYADLTDKLTEGGIFWRITPMVNWYVTDWTRLELVYGYGVLDRFAMKGATQFYQIRYQFQF